MEYHGTTFERPAFQNVKDCEKIEQKQLRM